MDIKKEIGEILDKFQLMGLEVKDVENELGYSPNAISQAMSRGGNKKLLKNLSTLLKAKNSKPVQSDLDAVITEMHTKIARLEDVISVLKRNDVYLLSRADGKNPSLVGAEMEEAISMESKARLRQDNKKQLF